MTDDLVPVSPGDAEEWRNAMLSIHIARSILRQWDLKAMMDISIRQDSIAPIIDPTMWRDKHEAAAVDRQCIEAALAFLREFPKEPESGRRNEPS